MEGMCEHFETCPLANKVEIFRYALDKTVGEDLCKVLWLKSQSSEIWLERRTNYTRSLAVMSMVGYILGLGDRHPSNIMLDRYSGKIVHIDFGDCFEVAMKREKFPEKIPFRLTRMLIKAMEVSGIEGNFRTTCENTMRVVRESKDSLLALLEAFVYDPLVSFRLLIPNMTKQ
jgi:FKBP12-rapamycin complex-associated protein